ncbi:SdpI family protein [Clostridium sp.]|uniref:SdpI family protein n=1 Tax=Clostridium sp. TaxID=1506 RepID=UPI002845AB4A|nr:SdpI family protein [Clostridium sp.]MDR3598690.1 SdpI family protein [Clostridium sp.]
MVLLTNILPSIIFIFFGTTLKLWPPKDINHVFGYRTFFAMKNNETWKEGNNFSGVMMILSGVIAFFFSISATFIYWNSPNISSVISGIGSIVIAFCFVFYTEVHLRKTFDENGKRKIESEV